MSLNIDRCNEITKKVCDLFETDASLDDLEPPTMDALRFLWDQANLLYDLVQERPEKEGRSSREYFGGVKLGELAYEIAPKLRDRGLKNPEEIALRIRLKAILPVQGHYHHIIGPAMLEHSEVLEKLGRVVEALENYDCIISDFSWFLDEYDRSEEISSEDDLVALDSLDVALNRRLKFELSLSEQKKLEEKLRKTKLLLSMA